MRFTRLANRTVDVAVTRAASLWVIHLRIFLYSSPKSVVFAPIAETLTRQDFLFGKLAKFHTTHLGLL